MRVILVRHGRTVENEKGLFQGPNHGTLSTAGRKQIHKLAMRLKNEQFDTVLSSDLERAVETTKAILRYHKNAHVQYLPLLRERNTGLLEGKKIEDYPEFTIKHGKPRTRPPHGENFFDVRKRAVQFWKLACKQYHGKSILVVSHTIFNRQLLGYLMKKSVMESFSIEQGNTAVNIIEVSERKKHLIHLVGCIAHL